MSSGAIDYISANHIYYMPGTTITIPYNYGFYAGLLVSSMTVWWLMPLDKPIYRLVQRVTFRGCIAVRSASGGRTNLGTADSPLTITSTNWNATGVRFAATHTASMGSNSDPVTVAIYLQDATLTFNMVTPV